MIIDFLIYSVVFVVIGPVAGLFGSIIPEIPESFYDSIDSYLDLIFSHLGLLDFFLPLSIIKYILPLAIFVWNFDKVYSLVLWIIKKIPFTGIS